MKEGFRQSMAWLHTWSGLVVGWILFFIFVTGTTGYVREEINRWMQPELPLIGQNIPSSEQQLDLAYAWLRGQPDAQGAERWSISLMSQQRSQQQFSVAWTLPATADQAFGTSTTQLLDPISGQIPRVDIKPRETGGGDALYTLHYALHYIPYDWGVRIVGICAAFMLLALITGIITHKKIFKDFFTFRPAKGQRSWLDAHNVLSVLALPFYLMITYSGFIFFLNAYMPFAVPTVYGSGSENEQRYYAELYPEFYPYQNKKDVQFLAISQNLPSLTTLKSVFQKVEQQWGRDQIATIEIIAANQYESTKLKFRQAYGQSISRSYTYLTYVIHTNGEVSAEPSLKKPAIRIFTDSMTGLHEGNFASAFVRWLYIFAGLIGSAMIATGLVLWTVKRRPKQLKNSKITFAHGLVERLNIAMIAGLPIGIALYFWANRIIPDDFIGRAAWEIHILFLTLVISFIYAYIRPVAQAWCELFAFASISYLMLPILNAITSDHGLWYSAKAKDWALFSLDVGFILLGLVLAWISYAIWRKRHQIFKSKQEKIKLPQHAIAPSQVQSKD